MEMQPKEPTELRKMTTYLLQLAIEDGGYQPLNQELEQLATRWEDENGLPENMSALDVIEEYYKFWGIR